MQANKRKVTCSSGDLRFDLAAKRKKTPYRAPNDKKGNMDCSTPEVLLQSILGNTKREDFFKEMWEKKPLHVTRSDEKFYGELFTLPVVKKVVETNDFSFLLDVNVSTYIDGEKEEFVEENGKVTLGSLERLMNENKASFQFGHPQRYIDELWNILEKLETYFGCLWAANAFITPAQRQASAPHCDDAENFILQIEGSEEWKLYKPMVELSRDFNQDVLEENLGDPILVVTMQPGDMLYFPRGVMYQSKAGEGGHSTYVALSTYQQNTWGDFMCHAVQQAIDNALEDDVSIRRGLPINFRSFLGTANNMDAYIHDDEKTEKGDASKEDSNMDQPDVVQFKEGIQECLAKLVDHIDVNKAADKMCTDFMASRLPPYGHCRCDADHAAADDAVAETASVTTDDTVVAETAPVSTDDAVVETAPVTADAVVAESAPVTADDAVVAEIAPVDEKEDATSKNDANANTESTPSTETDHIEPTTTTTTTSSKPTISLTDEVKIKYPDHFRVVYVNDDDDDDFDEESDYYDDDESQDSQTEEEVNDEGKADKPKKTKSMSSTGDDDDDDEDADVLDGEPHINVLHSLVNDRFSHMGFSLFTKIGCLKFDVSYAKALVGLVRAKGYVAVKDFQVETDEEKLLLASRLAGDDLLEIKS